VTRALQADYLVVGAGATGLAFADALVDHSDRRVIVVDRRDHVGGHWLDSYAFVRLHQASAFYGVASTLFGGRRLQQAGPEAGLYERASGAEVCTYFDGVMTERLLASGQVSFYPGCDYVGERRFVSSVSGDQYEVGDRCRVVDARYLAPDIPARTPPPFGVADGITVLPVNDIVHMADAPSQFVIVGSGKTATDACIWLLQRGVDPAAICWVRPRDPWMLNRAVVQPDPVVFLGMAADIMSTARGASSLDDLFLGLEEAGVMLRIDRGVTPTMAVAPTLATWELDQLRTISRVVRLGRVRGVEPRRLVMAEGEVDVATDAVVVHCAASGLKQPPLIPIWGQDAITLQPIRAGFPCFGAALAGYVEATRDRDAEKNKLCPPTPYANTLADWATMQVLGAAATSRFGAEPDIKAWADRLALNPAAIPPDRAGSQSLADTLTRLQTNAPEGLAQLAALAATNEH
jgi:hypothetical protein